MGTGDTIDTINLAGFLFAVAMGTLLVLLPRRLALLPIILTVCYMTIGQQVVLVDLHFSIIRVMILFGWFRVLVRRELMGFRFNEIDKLLIVWQASRVIMNTLQNGTMQAFIEVCGGAYDIMGIYFLLRLLIRDLGEVPRIIKLISIAVVPLAVLMLIERSTTRNLFAVFGGVSINTMVDEEGRLRCQGPFRHPILAGTFGAALLPFFLALWFRARRFRRFAVAGFAATAIIVLTAHSSGPAIAYVFGIIGMTLWHFRDHMRVIRWGILLALIALHLMMNDPVWALFGRIAELTGGTGYHRTMLIGAAIQHFGEWGLVGTHYTAHWMPYHLRLDATMVDMTNQYIYEGVMGGFLNMTLFIVLISFGFRAVGAQVRSMGSLSPFTDRIMVWSFGVSLFVHALSFMSVTYFDQNVVMFCLVLACISLCSERALNEREPHRAG